MLNRRRITARLGSFLVLLVAVNACSRRVDVAERASSSDAGTAVAGPVLSVAEPEFGFGDVVVGQPRSHRFTLKNVGASPLVIADVSGSCSCTVTELAVRQLAPGGSTTLTVNYRPNAMTGPDHQTIQLRTNDPVRPIFELTVRAMVQPEIRFEPPTLRLQTDAGSPKPVVARLVGTAVIRANLHIVELRGDKQATSQVDVKAKPAPYDADHRPELRVTLKRGHVSRGKVYAVVLTGLPDPTQIIVPIEWGTEPELTSSTDAAEPNVR